MAHTEIVSEGRAEQLVARWMHELDAMYEAGDTDGLKMQQATYAVESAQFLADGKLAPAERFAALAVHARQLLALPVRARELRRAPEVTEALMERDV